MKVIVDGIFFQDYQTGIARLWRAVLAEWCARGLQDRLVVIDRGGQPYPSLDALVGAGSRNQVTTVRTEKYRYDDPMAPQRLGDLCCSLGGTAFISSYYSHTAGALPEVMLVYDCIPEVMGWDLSHPHWQAKRACASSAKSFVCISQNTARDLASHYAPGERTVRYAHPGVDLRVFYPPPAGAVDEFRGRCGLAPGDRYVMCSSPGSGYKNVGLLYAAIDLLGWPYRVVATAAGAGRAPSHGGRALHLRLSDDDLRAAYGGAMALVYPSLYEGFGLPVIEAMACGCPVITTRRSSLPEAGGVVAAYIDGENVGELVKMLVNLDRCSQELRDVRRSAGVEWSKRFEWRTLAEAMWRQLEEVSA